MKTQRLLRRSGGSALLSSWLIISALSSTALAGGSSYSRFGLGDLLHYGGSRTDAMGGAGIALLGDGFINRLNPAGLARISNTRISGGFQYVNFSSEDVVGSGSFARGEFKGLAFGFPIDKEKGIALSLESTPFSSVHYAIENAATQLHQSFYGTGGLSLLGLGGSYGPAKDLLLGLKFNYLYGRIRQVGKFDFVDASFTDSDIHRSDFYSGFNFTIGAIYEGVSTLLDAPSMKPLTVGFIISTPAQFSVDRESVLTTGDNATSDTTFTSSGKVDLPLALGAGFSYQFSNRFNLIGDVYHQFWKEASLFGSKSADLRNSTRISLGFEALPERDIDTYWKRVAYRAGFYYHSAYYNINQTPINELFVTAGLGLPIGPDARLNVGLHAGIRGETSNNLQRDTIFRFTVSLSASEAWFLRFEEE